ncbi:MAG: NAD(P)H-dependent oxidoreductase subunit E [Anaeromassilibacillus sp.]
MYGATLFVKRGHSRLTRHTRRPWNLTGRKTTTDGRFHLETRNCLKKCGNAPNVMIDSTIHPSVRPEQVSAIIDQYS